MWREEDSNAALRRFLGMWGRSLSWGGGLRLCWAWKEEDVVGVMVYVIVYIEENLDSGRIVGGFFFFFWSPISLISSLHVSLPLLYPQKDIKENITRRFREMGSLVLGLRKKDVAVGWDVVSWW